MEEKTLLEKLAHIPFGLITMFGLLFLVIFAPIAFGAVHIWAYSLMEIVVFLLSLLFLLKSSLRKNFPDFKELQIFWISVGCFFLFVLFQLIPLPADVIEFLSPTSYTLFRSAIPGYINGELTEMWRCLSLNPYETKVSLVKYLAYLGVFILSAYGLRKEGKIEILILTLMAVAFFEVLYGFYERFEGQEIFGYPKSEHIDSVTGTYLNRNHFAGFIGMVITLSIGYLYGRFNHETHASHSIKDKVISFLNSPAALKYGLIISVIIILFLGLFFSLSRMGVLSLFSSLLLMVLIASLAKKGKMIFLTAGLLFFSVGVIVLQGTKQLEERIESVGSSANSRMLIWKNTVTLIGDYPLFGTGLGAYESAFRAYASELDDKRVLRKTVHAHNDYLELVAGVGLIGFIPFLTGMSFLMLLFFRKWQERRNSFAEGVSLGGIGAFTYMLIHSLADFNMHIPANALVLAMILGITYASLNIKHRSKRKRRERK